MNRSIQIEITIKHLAQQGVFSGKKLFIFGMNAFTAAIQRTLINVGYALAAILDNNVEKQGNEMYGLRICSPYTAAVPFDDNSMFIIASKYFSEMASQLEDMGYSCQAHVIQLLDSDSIASPDFISEQLIESGIESAKRGLKLYSDLCEVGSDTLTVFLSPVSSIGDIFLLGLYFSKFIAKTGISEYFLLIPGKAGVGIAESYGIKNVMFITQEDSADLMAFKMLIGLDYCDIRILHCGYLHQRIVCNIIMHRNMTWLENYRQFLFGFSKDAQFQRRKVNVNWLSARKTLRKNGLIPGKTVILSPYAQTLAPLSDDFWSELAKELKNTGFTVCTNVAGKEREIVGTTPLSFSLDDAETVLEQAGYFVALRSGLCDVVSMCGCKKIILYTQEVFECIKVIDFYSLNKMGLCNDAIEIEVTYNQEIDINSVIAAICADEEDF